MKSLRKILCWFMFLMVSLFFLSSKIEAKGKSLIVNQYHIDAKVSTNGDVRFKEEITFQANGSYNGIFYNLDYFGEEEPKDVSVAFKTSDGEVVSLAKRDTGNNSTYYSENSGKVLKFKVFLPFANDSRTVVFNYTIPHMIKNYRDTAELNRRVVGQNWEINQKNIRIHVTLPEAATKETLRAWGHGGSGGKVEIDPDYKGATFTVKRNQPGNFVETHMVFPTQITKDNPVTENTDAFQRIIETEESLVQKQVKEEQTKWTVVGFGAIISLISVVWAWWKGYLANKKRLAKVPFVPEHLFELPQDMSPAVMSDAIYNGIDMDDFSATVMNLVRKKVLTLTSHEPYILELKDSSKPLLPHEQLLLEILFEKIAKGNQLNLADVQDYAENCPQKYADMMQDWFDQVAQDAEEYSAYRLEKGERIPKSIGAPILGLLGIVLSVFGATKDLLSLIIAVVVSAIVYIIILRLSLVGTKQRSIKGEYEYRRWEAFRKMLVDISSLDRADLPSIQIWDHLLVYAISLGVAEEVIEVLEEKFPEWIQESIYYSPTYGWQLAMYHNILQDTFFDSYNSAMDEISSSSDSPNSGGFGGGFSGGSSFGSGGGSGGGGF